MNRFFSVITLLCTMLTLAGCHKEPLDDKSSDKVRFTLKATFGSPESKVSIDDSGIKLSWTPGDVLYLVDPAGNNQTVTLGTDITAAAKTASFYSEEVVSPGDYIVLYGQNTLSVSNDIRIKSTSDLVGQIRLYGSLTVADSQTSAEVTLKHLFAMLTFKFENLPAEGEITTMGMAVAGEGLKNLNAGEITADGLSTGYSKNFMTSFGWNNGRDSKSLIAPVDLSGNKVFFFVWGRNAEGIHTSYEFAKDGINLQEGNNYNITLDFSTATVSTIYKTESNANILTSAADFRAAAYWNSGLTFYLQNDIDFKDEAVFPIYSAGLWGNGHTLSNIEMNFSECSNVGVLSEGHGHNLNVISSTFTGLDKVGAICGDGYCEDCTCNSVTVSGRNQVGGLVGHADYNIKSSSLIGDSSVTGAENYVGGIAGFCTYDISDCHVKGNVLIKGSKEYTGGIAGLSGGSVSKCGVEAKVQGAQYTGGILGSGSCSNSYCYGDVTGTENVGGITGDSACSDCYHIGSVTGADDADYVGGISGASDTAIINYCYSYGTVSSGFGICRSLDGDCAVSNLTSAARFSSEIEASDNSNCGPEKTFLSKLSVLQSGNNSYVEACWPDLDAKCPLLKWQYDFGGKINIPDFIDNVW